ncbi:MAG TPA: hypothetical protein PK431_02095 [Chitinophagales bacterium]|nr:hypothetical protein [Chitinophagales bacterium]
MKKYILLYSLIMFTFLACNRTEKKEDASRFFNNYIEDIPFIKLPQTYVVNQENDSAFARPIDSVIAKNLDLEMSENMHEYGWEILGKIDGKTWIGLVYNLTYTNDYEKHFSTFDTAGNKVDDLILMSNDVQYFSPVKEGVYQSTIDANFRVNVENGFKLFQDEEHAKVVSNKHYYTTYQITPEGKFDVIFKAEKDLLNDVSEDDISTKNTKLTWKNEVTGNEIHLEITAKNKDKNWFFQTTATGEEGVDFVGTDGTYFTVKTFDEQTIGNAEFTSLYDTLETKIPRRITFTNPKKQKFDFVLVK